MKCHHPILSLQASNKISLLWGLVLCPRQLSLWSWLWNASEFLKPRCNFVKIVSWETNLCTMVKIIQAGFKKIRAFFLKSEYESILKRVDSSLLLVRMTFTQYSLPSHLHRNALSKRFSEDSILVLLGGSVNPSCLYPSLQLHYQLRM